VDQARLERLLAELDATEGSTSVLHRICVVCQRQTAVDGAGVTRLDHGTHELVIASDDQTAIVELLQLDLGEGPSIDSVRSFRRCHHADLASAEARALWPRFADAATQNGIAAAFAMPLLAGGVAVGSLGMYRRRTGELGVEQSADAEGLAELAALAVEKLDARTHIADLGISVESIAAWAYPAIVHNASGMVAEQLGIDVDHALLRLRALAFVRGCSVTYLARGVVQRDVQIEAWSDHD
jgi:transcriptional regulator with GAF, ATPase, and Fis domain